MKVDSFCCFSFSVETTHSGCIYDSIKHVFVCT